MPSHAKKGLPTIHVIHEAFVATSLENLEVFDAVLNPDIDEDAEDKFDSLSR